MFSQRPDDLDRGKEDGNIMELLVKESPFSYSPRQD